MLALFELDEIKDKLIIDDIKKNEFGKKIQSYLFG